MIPKTEKELELYFKLCELVEAKGIKDRPYTINYPVQESYNERYEYLKSEYLKVANEMIKYFTYVIIKNIILFECWIKNETSVYSEDLESADSLIELDFAIDNYLEWNKS